MISFIVPAHDEQRELGPALQAMHSAARALQLHYEIVVVSDASTDSTADIARAHGARVLEVGYRHIAAARNAGARRALGSQLVFVDADTRVDALLLAAALSALHAGAAGGGAKVRLLGRTRLYTRASVAVLGWLFRMSGIAPGCFLFCTRVAFEAAGGFDERYYAGEDVALSRALSRHGRFVILRRPVLTSARKLRTFSVREHLRLLVRFALRGRGVLHSRHDLQLWYSQRRDDGI
ncbi:MAG: glycosyl transferase family 2 [Xanthomonadaceae bacterium]|nr:glycosyl transferase family 2 [Xanthomonadaceae bacterium]